MDGTKEKIAPRAETAKRPDPSAWQQSELLSYKLAILSRLLERGSETVLARKYGLWLTDCRLLGHLLAKSPRTVRDLAEDMVMDKAPISRSASRLKASRTPEAPSGRRAGSGWSSSATTMAVGPVTVGASARRLISPSPLASNTCAEVGRSKAACPVSR